MPRIYRKVDVEKVESAVGELISDLSVAAISKRGRFTIGFSGGSSAAIVSKGLLANSDKIDWSKWHVFFCDERHVNVSDPDSNYKAIHDKLLKHVTIPKANIHHINDGLSLEESRLDYEKQLKDVFSDQSAELPSIDCLVLGMGPDGHICSLFPDHPLLQEREKLIASISDSPKPPPGRITLTLPVVNNAKDVVFIATGSSKAATVKQVLEDPLCPLPAALVKPVDGEVHWYIDNPAGGQLTTR